MTITDIKVRKLLPEGRLKAVVSITLDDTIAIHDIKVIEGSERLFIAMPSRKDESGCYRDIAHPISFGARADLEQKILSAYYDAVGHSISS
ncbi:MAG: septation regulator SpoVG [Ruminococcus sp.]|nr:septation regulator SpoVG [Ruminococcus sp.]